MSLIFVRRGVVLDEALRDFARFIQLKLGEMQQPCKYRWPFANISQSIVEKNVHVRVIHLNETTLGENMMVLSPT